MKYSFKKKPKSKFGNIKCEADGFKFDSKKEREWYYKFKLMQRQGYIKNLELQPKFKFEVSGKPLKHNGKGAKQITYTADFRYYDIKADETIVVDVKSKATAKEKSFVIKKALMWTLYNIALTIVN